jgi:hypothetical protein
MKEEKERVRAQQPTKTSAISREARDFFVKGLPPQRHPRLGASRMHHECTKNASRRHL